MDSHIDLQYRESDKDREKVCGWNQMVNVNGAFLNSGKQAIFWQNSLFSKQFKNVFQLSFHLFDETRFISIIQIFSLEKCITFAVGERKNDFEKRSYYLSSSCDLSWVLLPYSSTHIILLAIAIVIQINKADCFFSHILFSYK